MESPLRLAGPCRPSLSTRRCHCCLRGADSMRGALGVQAHFVLDEMLVNGCIFETNKVNILTPVQLLDRVG